MCQSRSFRPLWIKQKITVTELTPILLSVLGGDKEANVDIEVVPKIGPSVKLYKYFRYSIVETPFVLYFLKFHYTSWAQGVSQFGCLCAATDFLTMKSHTIKTYTCMSSCYIMVYTYMHMWLILSLVFYMNGQENNSVLSENLSMFIMISLLYP